MRPRFREKTVGADGQPEAPPYVPLPSNQWRESITAFTKSTVIKMPRVFQTLFYLLGYNREDICERGTNKLEWKKAKLVLLGGPTGDGTEFFRRIGEFTPFGAKNDSFKAYQKLRFCRKNIKRFEEKPELVEEYSIPLAKLFKWILVSLDMRGADVTSRRELKEKLKVERKAAEDAFAERERLRNEATENAKFVRIITQ